MPTSRTSRSLGLRARATLAWGLIALVLSAGLSTLAYQLTRQQLVAERSENAVTRAYLNARVVRSALRGPSPDVAAVLSSLEGNAGSVLLARVGGDWFSGSVGTGPDSLPSSLTDVVAGGDAGRQVFRVSGQPYVGIGVPIPEVDTRYFELVPLDDVEGTLDRLADGLMAGAVIATLAAAGAGWYASRRVLRPLRAFTTAASKIAKGSLDTRLETLGDRDLRALERAFNQMAEAVQQRIDREARFTSDVSHELRAPVVAMLSTIHIARRRLKDPDAAGQALDDLEARVAMLQKLVDDLLEISRAEAGVAHLQLESVDPVRITKAVLDTMGKGSIPVEVSGQVPKTLHADKRRLGQMLQNLVDNADRYAGGAIRIEVSASDGLVRFAVEDHGEGVAEHERSYIFERFARGEEASRTHPGDGTGLGLSLVAEHAALHHGSIRLEDRPGGGSRFVIELPQEPPQ